MKPSEKEAEYLIRPRPAVDFTLRMPQDVLDSLVKTAREREMEVDALIRLYVGQGLRQDIARLFADRMFDSTATVLARHLQSAEEVSLILEEIRETAGVK